MRIVALDTETTGTEIGEGHRIIEIGCVEIENRKLTGREFRRLINPERSIDPEAYKVHGISEEDVADQPVFAEIEAELVEFISGAEVIMHNAGFDVGFIERELSLTPSPLTGLETVCEVTDTLQMARSRHPGQRNNIDALCKRYDIDASAREKHGALLDARLLAQVYLAMTGGQISLVLGEESRVDKRPEATRRKTGGSRAALTRYEPTEEEKTAHEALLNKIDGLSENGCLWLKMETSKSPEIC